MAHALVPSQSDSGAKSVSPSAAVSLCLQAVADKQQNSRRLMADNTHLLADVAELQRSNRELSLKLAAATRQLTALQQSQQEESTARAGAPGSRPSSASPASRHAGNSPSVQK